MFLGRAHIIFSSFSCPTPREPCLFPCCRWLFRSRNWLLHQNSHISLWGWHHPLFFLWQTFLGLFMSLWINLSILLFQPFIIFSPLIILNHYIMIWIFLQFWKCHRLSNTLISLLVPFILFLLTPHFLKKFFSFKWFWSIFSTVWLPSQCLPLSSYFLVTSSMMLSTVEVKVFDIVVETL